MKKKFKALLSLLKYSFSHPYRTEWVRNNITGPVKGKEKVAFIVTFYNQLPFTKKCVESYYNSIDDEYHYILILLDDHSTDESPNYFGGLEDLRNCCYLRFYENRGLTRSWNFGVDFAIRQLKADYIFLSNNDVILSRSAIPAMMKALKGRACGGFVGPLTNSPGYHASQDVRCFLPNYEASDHLENIECTAAACSGNKVMRWDELNGFLFGGSRKSFESNRFIRLIPSLYFDPRNRNFHNETEFQLRLRKKGGKVYLAGDAFVFHYKEITIKRSDISWVNTYYNHSQGDWFVGALRHFLQNVSCEYQERVLLSDFTTLRVGGPARIMVFPNDREKLKQVILFCRKHTIPHVMLGKGANTLAGDYGYEGVVIQMSKFNLMRFQGECVTADSGVSVQKLCLNCSRRSLTGLEFAYPIPGTVGGFIFMNAGLAPDTGVCIGNLVESVEVFDGTKTFKLMAQECDFGYRRSIFQKHADWTILAVTFRLRKGSREEVLLKFQESKKRFTYQDRSFPNAGSVFIGGEISAGGTFYDLPGIRGKKIGGAQFSRKRANWILNTDFARAADMMALINHATQIHHIFRKPAPQLEWRQI